MNGTGTWKFIRANTVTKQLLPLSSKTFAGWFTPKEGSVLVAHESVELATPGVIQDTEVVLRDNVTLTTGRSIIAPGWSLTLQR